MVAFVHRGTLDRRVGDRVPAVEPLAQKRQWRLLSEQFVQLELLPKFELVQQLQLLPKLQLVVKWLPLRPRRQRQ